MEQMLARLAQLKAEGDAIMQQLIAAGMPPEQIMAAVEGGGQPAAPPTGMNIPGMGGQPGPDLPPVSQLMVVQEFKQQMPLWAWVVAREDYLALGDDNRVSADQGRFNPKWRSLFRDTSRRWRMFRLSNKAISNHRDTFRC